MGWLLLLAAACDTEAGPAPLATAGSAGATSSASAGTSGAPGSAGTPAGASGGTNGGSSSTAGVSGVASNAAGAAGVAGAAGAAGAAAAAGAAGAAGAGGSAGAAGTGGTSSAGGSGGSGPGVAESLQGLTIQVRCGAAANQMRSCNYVAPADANCNSNQLRAYATATAKMGGAPGTFYDVTLHVRGIVEANVYTGGTSDMNGFYVGGNVGGQGGPQYSQYSLEVSSPATVYHLNQLDPGAQQDKYKNADGSVVHHFGFVIDYHETIKVEGGATVSLFGRDNDCLMGRNCEPPANDFGKCTLQKIAGLTEQQVPQGASGFDGNFVWIDVEQSAISK